MGEREATREREAGRSERDYNAELTAIFDANRRRSETGRIVIRGKDTPWQQNRQALAKFFLHPAVKDTALGGWQVFLHEIRSHSGKHRHQGGLALYVVEGKGYTTVNDQRVDWEEGDLILLPIMPDGVEHQHFNLDPEKPSTWLALIPHDLRNLLANYTEQVEVSPDWRTKG